MGQTWLVQPPHGQTGYRVRLDWGLDGARAVGADTTTTVVVDVLSFTTTLTVALDMGAIVYPYRWNDETAEQFARENDAVLAVGRSQAGTGQVSLSPATLRVGRPPRRLVLPSPNSATIAHHLATQGAPCLAASLRNAAAVAHAVTGSLGTTDTVAFVAAGERWPDGGLRPSVEDLWGAGAVIAHLSEHGWSCSPEANAARAAYEAVRGQERGALLTCASGRELAQQGYTHDVTIAAEINTSTMVPVLQDGQFTDATPPG
jgi:2-phosphosulfolactate phosphatase